MGREFVHTILLLASVAVYFNSALAQNLGQKVYKAVINDTTLPSTQLFTVNVMGATSYGIGGEMMDGFAIDEQTGVVSTTQQLDVGRYEFIITAQSGSLPADITLSLFVGLVDVLSTTDGCDNQILYGMCSHTCVGDSNDPNGYRCQCNSGYSLQRNGYICRANDPEPSLLISYTSGGLAKLDAFTRKIETIANDTQVEAFDYHYGYQIIYYTDGSTLYSVDISGQNTISLYGRLNQVTSIAANWLNSDVYFTAANGIEKITIAGTIPVRTSVLSGRSSPRHLVLDAEDEVMYWIEGSNSNANIYKAALDGSGIIIIATNVNNSQDLSVDIVEHRVYWNAVSGSIYQIRSAAEDGSDITTVYDSDILHSASISVFEDYVYSVKESTRLILRVDKFTRLTGVNVTLSAEEEVDIIKVYHRLKQPNSVKDTDECAVNNGGCSQICTNVIGGFSCECYTGYQQNQLDPSSCLVPETCSATGCDHSCVLDSSNVASCVCDPGYKLSDDEFACLDINECVGSHGCSHGCTNTNGSFQCTCPDGLFLSDDRRNCNGCAVNNGGCGQICIQDSVGYSCSCLDGYILGSDGKDCHYSEIPELLVSSSRQAISTYNGRVYLVETDGTELERNVDVTRGDLNTGLIYAIEYSLDTGRIYFSDRNASTLWTASIDNEIRASDDRKLVTAESVHAWAFAYDWISECLYWSDDRSNQIGKLNEQSNTVEYIAYTTGSPQGIAVDPFHRKIFWSEPSGIKSLNLNSNVTTTIYTSLHDPSGLTIDILQERIFFVENIFSQSNIYSTDYYGQDVALIVEDYPSVIPFQIAYADNFIYWTRDSQQLERAHVCGTSLVSSVPVTLQTESGSDSSFFSLVAVSTLHRPPAGICYPNPCLNGGLCSDDGQGLRSCFCKDNYFGENCALENHCMVNPCQNGGLCNLSNANPSGFNCQCPEGYIGDKCEQINFCRNIECENGGTCENGNNSFICTCTAGYTGETCDVNIDDCDGVVCQNGGTCVDQVNGFICNCTAGYTGETCDVNIDDCNGVICQNGGSCVDQVNGFICNCTAGYTGETCDANIDDCDGIVCQNGGTCVDQVNDFVCNCTAGYTGETCDVNIDDCDGVVCQNGGTCVDQVNGFICNCTAGYTGETCDVNIDDCDGIVCQNGGTCVDQVNGFICNCTAGYTGETCDGNIDDCDGIVCQNGGTCVDQVNGFICNCTAGYTGETCDVNIDDCDGIVCQNGGTCVDRVNGFICNCTAGYTGETCDVNIDDCDGVVCQNGGTCVDQVNGFICNCIAGYTGETCDVNIDDCDGIVCQNGGSCVDQVNTFSCNCTSGFTGEFCEMVIDNCVGAPCQNGGTCQNGNNSFICTCTAGYTGETCDVNIDDCDGVVCQNGGSCVDQVNGFICNCVAGYTGDTCDLNIDDCDGIICQNEGSCVDQVNGFICNCVAGYTGETCDVNIDDCDGVVCQNGGTCFDQVNGFNCSCTTGYTGETCDININDCEGIICQNGGTCVDQVNSFFCDCADGYTGDRCETPICTEPCQNGGTCIAPDECQCTEFLGGPTCTIPICPERFCGNGGTCNPTFTGATCLCLPGFIGTRCEARDPRFGRVQGGEEGLTEGETAGVSVGAILGVGVIIILLMFTLFLGHRYWRRRMSFKTVDSNTMYGNPVYYEARDIGGKDVLGKEQALDNPVYGIYSKPADDDLHITTDDNSNSDSSASMDASNDALMEHVYVNTKVDLPQDTENSPNSNDIV